MPKRNKKHPGVWVYVVQTKDGRSYRARGPVIERMDRKGRKSVTIPATTRATAEAWARRQSKMDEARRVGVMPSVTFGEFVGQYERELDLAGYAQNTKVGYLWAARHAANVLGRHTSTEFTQVSHLHQLRRSVTGATRQTMQTKWRRLSRLFSELRRQGLVPHLTADAIRDCFVPARGPVREASRPRCLTRDEIAAMLAATDHPLPMFLLLTGMRVRAALGLTWEMVNLEARRLELPASLVKTKKPRNVQLRWRPTLEDWLHDRKQESGPVFGGETYDSVRKLLVYHSHKGGKSSMQDGPLRQAVPGLKWKDLRSTCASHLHSLPISATHMERAQDMGHSLTTAERLYVDVVTGLARGADTLEAAMGLLPEDQQDGGIVLAV